jgi:hypothetical protein
MKHNCERAPISCLLFLSSFYFESIGYIHPSKQMIDQWGRLWELNSQLAQRNIIVAGKPSVFLRRQLCQIWGNSWMHQRTVPIVPRTFDAKVTFPSDILDCGW